MHAFMSAAYELAGSRRNPALFVLPFVLFIAIAQKLVPQAARKLKLLGGCLGQLIAFGTPSECTTVGSASEHRGSAQFSPHFMKSTDGTDDHVMKNTKAKPQKSKNFPIATDAVILQFRVAPTELSLAILHTPVCSEDYQQTPSAIEGTPGSSADAKPSMACKDAVAVDDTVPEYKSEISGSGNDEKDLLYELLKRVKGSSIAEQISAEVPPPTSGTTDLWVFPTTPPPPPPPPGPYNPNAPWSAYNQGGSSSKTRSRNTISDFDKKFNK